jgi:hypothetical protein
MICFLYESVVRKKCKACGLRTVSEPPSVASGIISPGRELIIEEAVCRYAMLLIR